MVSSSLWQFKLNYDGASRENPSRVGIRVVIFYHKSQIVKVGCHDIGIGTNNYAEFRALSFGQDLTISLGIKNIIFEGDSMVTFQAVINKKSHSWHL